MRLDFWDFGGVFLLLLFVCFLSPQLLITLKSLRLQYFPFRLQNSNSFYKMPFSLVVSVMKFSKYKNPES